VPKLRKPSKRGEHGATVHGRAVGPCVAEETGLAINDHAKNFIDSIAVTAGALTFDLQQAKRAAPVGAT
jgi:hypothetical protein